jgi:hypothetical protein
MERNHYEFDFGLFAREGCLFLGANAARTADLGVSERWRQQASSSEQASAESKCSSINPCNLGEKRHGQELLEDEEHFFYFPKLRTCHT